MSNRFEAERAKKLETIKSLGHDPYGKKLPREPDPIGTVVQDITLSLANSHDMRITNYRRYFSKDDAREGLGRYIAGRVVSKNNKGKLKFFWVKDDTGSIQVMFSKNQFDEKEWELVSCIEVGDIIAVPGLGMKTEAGEITLFAGGCLEKKTANPDCPKTPAPYYVEIVCKSLAHPPEKFHGIKNEEIMIRQRYLPMIWDDDLLKNLIQRSRIISSLRKYLNEEGFLEVETPVLMSQESGAAAKPFSTHHNALDMDLKLRIAPELALKKLLVGGMPKIYEIGKVFRNEGIDKTHNPEFTIMELYWAYADLTTIQELTADLIKTLAKGTKAQVLFERFHVMSYSLAFNMHYHKDIFKDEKFFVEEAKKPIGDEPGFESVNYWKVIDHLFDKVIQPNLINPTFIVDYPIHLCPLAKPNKDNQTSGRFELFVNGMELANAYTELNNPEIQKAFFMEQGLIDEDFLNALKVGMPPAGGLGIGIDRLVMLLLGLDSIRDVINFPLTRN